MIRRLAGLGLGLIALLAPVAPAGAAPLPEGPRLAFGVWGVAGKRMDLTVQTVGADGRGRRALAGKGRIWVAPFDGGSWSPDGSVLAFSGAPRKVDGEQSNRIYLVSADGGAPTEVPRTRGASEPVFSPDGRTLAFSRTKLEFDPDFEEIANTREYFSTTTWIVDLASGQSRQLTRWRNGFRVEATSFSPDGGTLLAEREMGEGAEVVTLDVATGRMALFARDAQDAAFSPDGSRVALVSDRDRVTVDGADGPIALGELYVVSADGSRWQRLTRNRTREEEAPSWDPSGQRLAFAQTTGPGTIGFGFTNVVMQVNADGSCPSRLVGVPRPESRSSVAFYAPTWRPGPGREAGPIACAR
jgi:Tol biopolymer transport system component